MKTPIQTFYDKGLLDNCVNADDVLIDYLFQEDRDVSEVKERRRVVPFWEDLDSRGPS